MDHLARIAMKNAANCVKYGEMQGYRNRYMSNAYCGPVIHLTGPHLSEGLLNITSISGLARHMRQTTAEYWDSPWRYIGGELRPQYFGCFLCALALCVRVRVSLRRVELSRAFRCEMCTCFGPRLHCGGARTMRVLFCPSRF